MMDMPETIWAKCEDMHGAIQVGGWADTVRQCPDGIQYRRADLPPRVNPLVWLDFSFCGQPAAYAETEFGDWMVIKYTGRDGNWAYCDPAGNDSDDDWATRTECEAAAQADYTARILAALEGEA